MKSDDDRSLSARAGRSHLLATAAVVLAAALALASGVTAEEGSDLPPSANGSATAAELEVLRRLLGLPSTAEQPSPDQPEAVEEPVTDAPPIVEPEPVSRPSPPPRRAPKPAPARPAKPAPKPAPKSAPKSARGSAPAAEARGDNAPRLEENNPTTTTATVPSSTAVQPEPAAGQAGFAPSEAIPPAGTVVSAKNIEQWKHLLGPSVQWSVERGATIDVVDHKPVPLEHVRAEATQRYSGQVQLSADKRSMRNYVAGIPFPFVSEDDPDAAPKLMFNMENRINQDDLDVRNFSCDTGTLDGADGFSIQRHYEIDHFRRFYHVGRLWVDPKPELPDNIDGVRYREMLHPIVEPFDLKGSGFTYIRYLDPNRQDDSWLYFPQLKRVRRIGTAQRSEGVFGQDVDLDSYAGYAGNPAWTKWTLLGKKTILASMHARNVPSRFQDAPAAFFPDDVWEPREVWVILGISQLGGYNFGRRVIYLDAETWIVPYTEIYDLKGGLWRTLIHTWNADTKPIPTATRAVYEDDTMFISAFTLIDMQLNHATRCQFPSPDAKGEEGWYYRFGAAEGTTEEKFSVSNFIQAGR